ncbi:hypothetical protein ABZ412_03975 [Nocardia sp. NPDC005746]|uniref:hypothetical protein n=1 Tax=Nocardia sp. NPDC005746 TaxID=3157062 RepID=UPI0033F5E474
MASSPEIDRAEDFTAAGCPRSSGSFSHFFDRALYTGWSALRPSAGISAPA